MCQWYSNIIQYKLHQWQLTHAIWTLWAPPPYSQYGQQQLCHDYYYHHQWCNNIVFPFSLECNWKWKHSQGFVSLTIYLLYAQVYGVWVCCESSFVRVVYCVAGVGSACRWSDSRTIIRICVFSFIVRTLTTWSQCESSKTDCFHLERHIPSCVLLCTKEDES